MRAIRGGVVCNLACYVVPGGVPSCVLCYPKGCDICVLCYPRGCAILRVMLFQGVSYLACYDTPGGVLFCALCYYAIAGSVPSCVLCYLRGCGVYYCVLCYPRGCGVLSCVLCYPRRCAILRVMLSQGVWCVISCVLCYPRGCAILRVFVIPESVMPCVARYNMIYCRSPTLRRRVRHHAISGRIYGSPRVRLRRRYLIPGRWHVKTWA